MTKEVALDGRVDTDGAAVSASGQRGTEPRPSGPGRLLLAAKAASGLPGSRAQSPRGPVCTVASRPPPLLVPSRLYGVNEADFTALLQRGKIQQTYGHFKRFARDQSRLGRGRDVRPRFLSSSPLSVS